MESETYNAPGEWESSLDMRPRGTTAKPSEVREPLWEFQKISRLATTLVNWRSLPPEDRFSLLAQWKSTTKRDDENVVEYQNRMLDRRRSLLFVIMQESERDGDIKVALTAFNHLFGLEPAKGK